MARSTKKQPAKKAPRRRIGFGRILLGLILVALLVTIPVVGIYVFYLDYKVTSQFEGKRWALPARVFARPLEIYEGLRLRPDNLLLELKLLGYRAEANGAQPGTYHRAGNTVRLTSRPFRYPDGDEPSRHVEIRFEGNTVASLRSVDGGSIDLLRLEPALIGSIYPAQAEDRLLVRLEEVPPLLVDALLSVEDRDFYQHGGISFVGLARAAVANLRSGRVVQGGSTITQQLVKNFFLSSERTLSRKINEAIMAMLLEYHYSKQEILEAYLNEVYLGQDGPRAIHGFGMASQFFFGRPLAELQPHQLALLAGLVKGPSYYDPRRNPQRALERRNLVLTTMVGQGVLSAEQAKTYSARPLDVTPVGRGGDSPYPAFMELVKEHLRRDYRPEDLATEGLRVFTTLAPYVQHAAEDALLSRLKQWRDQKLEGAVVVVDVDDGSVLGLVAGREVRYPGFNRALHARRQIGSLIKPAVYLAALERPAQFGLGTLLPDEPISMADGSGKLWEPKNYDGQLRGQVPLWDALARSYNLPTVHLGLQLGMRQVADTMQRLGLKPPSTAYPSLFLGAVNYTPMEIAQAYLTLASGGFRTELRAVRAVMTRDGTVLSRYPLAVQRAFDGAPVYLLNYALQAAIWRGTGQSSANWLGPRPLVAGKTGTTDDTRDSWFAGFSADTLAVAWVGRDDNAKTGLTGATGALTVWSELFKNIDWEPLELVPPESIEALYIDPANGMLATEGCDGAMVLPYVRGFAPALSPQCIEQRNVLERASDWFRGIFNEQTGY